MKLLMHILKKNKEEGIDNETLEIDDIAEKLTEEFGELNYALKEYKIGHGIYNLTEVIRETFDLIQVCILILFRANKEAKRLGKNNLLIRTNEEHNAKLKNRSWEFGEEIDIEVR